MDITIEAVLPEECISAIISLTSPPDACRCSLLSRIFRSAAGSDLVWERFLPPDYQQIISQSESSVSSLLNVLPKKDLYFHLCRNPILIGNGNMSFAIEKWSGKKCYMLGARELCVIWGDDARYWKWVSSAKSPVFAQSRSLSNALFACACVHRHACLSFLYIATVGVIFLLYEMCRFSEVAHLLRVYWLLIGRRIETNILSPNTRYGAYFVYTLVEDHFYGFDRPMKVSIEFENENEDNATNDAYLLPDTPGGQNGQVPRRREDMWLEVEIGEFFNGQVDRVVDMRLGETKVLNMKSGLVVHGIELRPKE